MPEEIKRVDYFSLELAHKAGEGARVLGALRDAGIDLTGVWGYQVSARKARLEIIPKDSSGFAKAAKQAGIAVGKKMTAFLVSGEDRVGAVAGLMEKLAAAGINVVAMKAVCAGEGRFGGAVFVEPADVRKAAKALGAA